MTVPASDVSSLVFEQPPPVPMAFNVLLYGPPKTGKSTAAATAPGPILWVNAEGTGALSFARKVARQRGNDIYEVKLDRKDDAVSKLRDVLKYVRENEDVRTVVVDTLAKVRTSLIKQIVKPGASNSFQQFGEVADILRDFVLFLRDEPVNLVLIAHQDVQDADGERIVRALIGGALTEEIPGEVDVIAYTHTFKDEESGERRYVGQLVEARGRIAGDRSGGLGPFRDLDLEEWLATYRDALTPDNSDLPFPMDDDAVDDAQEMFEATELGADE